MKGEENTFEFLVDYITAKVVGWVMEEDGADMEKALLDFHNSEIFEKLCDCDTALYIESPAFIHEIYKEERRRGTLRGLSE